VNTNIFDEIYKEPGHFLIDEAVSKQKIPIGYTCSYVPEVMLKVGNLFPVRLRAPGVSDTEIADIYLSSVICSYTRSILEFAMDDQYDFLGGIIFTASCDHLRRLYDNLIYLMTDNFYHILDIGNIISKDSKLWLIDELKIFANKISDNFQIEINDDVLAEAISSHNKMLGILQSIGDLRKNPKPPLSGTDFHKLIIAAFCSPQEEIMPHILNFKENLQNSNSKKDYKARIMLVGGQIDDPDYIDLIESTGALVVADRFCTGSLPGLELISEEKKPYDAICENIFNKTMCPRMINDFYKRLNNILAIVEEYKVDGVIVENIKFCDIWGIDTSQLLLELRKRDIPVLRLEREYRLTGEGQLSTRVQAFLESITKN